jgi:hypothetical protein
MIKGDRFIYLALVPGQAIGRYSKVRPSLVPRERLFWRLAEVFTIADREAAEVREAVLERDPGYLVLRGIPAQESLPSGVEAARPEVLDRTHLEVPGKGTLEGA